jgi:hypothetical protein
MRRDVRRQVLRALRQVPLPIGSPYGARQWVAGMLVHGPVVFDAGNQVGLAVQFIDGRGDAWRASMWEPTEDFTKPPVRRLPDIEAAVEEAREKMVAWVGYHLG